MKTESLERLASLKDCGELSIIDTPESMESIVDLVSRNDEERRQLLVLPLDGCSDATVRETAVRIRWLRALHDIGYYGFKASQLWAMDIQHLAQKLSLPVRTSVVLAGWEARGANDASALIPGFSRRGGANQARINPEADELLASVIVDARNGKYQLRPSSVYSELQHRIDKKNLEPDRRFAVPKPSLSTVTRRFRGQVSTYERDVARLGKGPADRLHEATGVRRNVGAPGLVYEFDDLDSKTFVIDEVTGLGWGRPWITAGVDQHSKFPVGVQFDNKPRSAWSAICALVNSIEVKDMTALGLGGLGLQWESYGYPCGTIFDNATYNDERFVSLDADIADPGWARPFKPRDKREIEYLNRQTVAFFRTLPGWRGPLDDPDALKEGLESAVMSLEKFRRLYFKWLLGDYSNSPMSNGRTPREMYTEAGQMDLRARMPPDPRRLRLLRTIPLGSGLRWSSSGVRTMGLVYQNEELYRRWIRRPGGRLLVDARIDAEDISQLFISIPGTNELLILPCLSQTYAHHMTLYQQKLVLKLCRQKKLTHPSLTELFATRHELAAMTAKLRVSGKVRDRRRAVRAGAVPNGSKPSTKTEAVHDLQQAYEDLDAVEVSEGAVGWAMPA
ncbi:hypothetical protein [Pelomonas sp. KK5]|uniref:hypothetical protein n=1 Tax=Pelomonas sp. KK5 TaxID=1855730 RepID=UPI0011805C3F|nr:hypothetical protein [Pelomonas sp. KK5]